MTLQEIAPIIELDLERSFALFMGKEETYVKYLKKFPETAEQLLVSLSAAVENKNYDAIGAAAHAIKGVAANLGIQAVTALSAALMADIRDNTPEKIAEHYPPMVEKTELAVKYIKLLD